MTTSRPWTAERVVPVALARSLVEGQFPELAPAKIEPLAVGWDNTAYRVNDVYVFRFPRRQIAVDLIETEVRLLPAVAPRLPLAVPVPTLVGCPERRFPWPFAGYRMLPGRTACRAALDEDQRLRAAEPLARFLTALHAFPIQEATRLGAPPDTLGRLDLAQHAPTIRARLEEIARAGLVDDLRPLRRMLEEVAEAPAPRATALVHGDLYARHLLVDDQDRPTGVIDWGDLHVGDPAVDLALVHSFLPPSAHGVFCHSYGPVDERTWRLARLRALHHSAAVVVYAHDIGDADLLREGLTALAHLAAGTGEPG